VVESVHHRQGREIRRDCIASQVTAHLLARRSDPSLGHHLTASIKTGYFCSYNPHLDRPVAWKFWSFRELAQLWREKSQCDAEIPETECVSATRKQIRSYQDGKGNNDYANEGRRYSVLPGVRQVPAVWCAWHASSLELPDRRANRKRPAGDRRGHPSYTILALFRAARPRRYRVHDHAAAGRKGATRNDGPP